MSGIKLTNVTKLYQEGDFKTIALDNISLNVAPGEKIAIVGPTGCGKTTLINLLMRFYDVNEGEITVDGINIKDIKKGINAPFPRNYVYLFLCYFLKLHLFIMVFI